MRRQLENQKSTNVKYREAKYVLQERLNRCEQLLKYVIPTCASKSNKVSKISTLCQLCTQNVENGKTPNHFANAALALMRKCVDNEGNISTEVFHTQLRKALDIPQLASSPQRPINKVGIPDHIHMVAL